MSKHYWRQTTMTMDSLSEAGRANLFAKLAKTNPILAAKLQKLDWDVLTAHVLGEAMEAAAKDNKWSFVKKPARGNLPNELAASQDEIIACVSRSRLYVVASRNKMGAITFHMGRYDGGYKEDNPTEWKTLEAIKKDIEKAYLVKAVEAMAKLIGQDVTTEKTKDGKTVVKAKVRTGK